MQGRDRRWRALATAVAVAALPPAAAQASIPLSGAKGEPLDTTQQDANTRFHIHLNLGGSEQLKDLSQKLPFGIGPDLLQPTCPVASFEPDDNCPAKTRIGTTTVVATLAGVPLPQTVSGRIYYLEPAPDEAYPELGIVLEPPSGPKVFQRGKTEILADGIATTINDFPQATNIAEGPLPPINVPTRIDSLDIVLVKSFLRNPTTCTPATTSFSAVSYEDPSHTSTTDAAYTPTGCPPPPPRAKPRCGGRVTTMVGTAKHDVIAGTRGRDVIAGLGGNDTLKGLRGNDLLCGGPGRDRLFGGRGRDRLLGGPGKDELRGGPGKDVRR